MNAKEARERALIILKEKDNKCYGKIKEDIITAVLNGKFVTTYYDNLTEIARNKLKDEGYTLHKSLSGINYWSWIIKW